MAETKNFRIHARCTLDGMKDRLLAISLICIAIAQLGAVMAAAGFALDSDHLMDIGGILTVPATLIMGAAVLIVLIGSPAVALQALLSRRRD
jgi:hypothetical protein